MHSCITGVLYLSWSRNPINVEYSTQHVDLNNLTPFASIVGTFFLLSFLPLKLNYTARQSCPEFWGSWHYHKTHRICSLKRKGHFIRRCPTRFKLLSLKLYWRYLHLYKDYVQLPNLCYCPVASCLVNLRSKQRFIVVN